MSARPRDRWFSRYIGPADRLHGEFRGEAVEILDATPNGPMSRVRFPNGSVSMVHEDHLAEHLFRGVNR